MTGFTMPDADRAPRDGHLELASVSSTQIAGVSVITVTGELDIANIGQLTEAIRTLTNTSEGLVVDLTECRYIDSTTVSVLHDLAMRLRQRTQRLVVVSPPASPPRRVLELTALQLTAAVVDEIDPAIKLAGSTLD